MSYNIDLRLSPLTVDLYVILDVLVAVGLDLARSSEQETITRSLHEHMTRDRQGLELVSRMLKEFAVRHGQDGDRGFGSFGAASSQAGIEASVNNDAGEAEGILTAQKTNVVASSR